MSKDTWHVDTIPSSIRHGLTEQGRLFLADVNGDDHLNLFTVVKVRDVAPLAGATVCSGDGREVANGDPAEAAGPQRRLAPIWASAR